jgi:four helix bundle protein
MGLYRKLAVWEKAINLVEEVYKIQFPQSENFALASQLKRASISIPSNIAEGNGRNSNKDFIRFLQISKGSLFELQTQIEISTRLNYINEEKYDKLMTLSQEIEAMIEGLIKRLKD